MFDSGFISFQCKTKYDCFAYLFKPLEDFKAEPNTFESNCMLESAYDRSFLSEQARTENEYKSKVNSKIIPLCTSITYRISSSTSR